MHPERQKPRQQNGRQQNGRGSIQRNGSRTANLQQVRAGGRQNEYENGSITNPETRGGGRRWR